MPRRSPIREPPPSADSAPWATATDGKLNIHALQDDKLTIKISIAYRDGNDAVWKVKSEQDVTVHGASSADNGKDSKDSKDKPNAAPPKTYKARLVDAHKRHFGLPR